MIVFYLILKREYIPTTVSRALSNKSPRKTIPRTGFLDSRTADSITNSFSLTLPVIMEIVNPRKIREITPGKILSKCSRIRTCYRFSFILIPI